MAERTCLTDKCRHAAVAQGYCKGCHSWLRRSGQLARVRPATLEGRLWLRVDKNGPLPAERPELGPCWIWTGKRSDKDYGLIYRDGSFAYAHRVAYEICVGPIPDGLVIDHVCRTPRCVRADGHLEPVTQAVNIERGDLPATKEAYWQRLRAKTHCKHGHEFTPANTNIRANGTRACRACHRIREAERKAAKRAAA